VPKGFGERELGRLLGRPSLDGSATALLPPSSPTSSSIFISVTSTGSAPQLPAADPLIAVANRDGPVSAAFCFGEKKAPISGGVAYVCCWHALQRFALATLRSTDAGSNSSTRAISISSSTVSRFDPSSSFEMTF
jgi:hypothetical protein